jgi:hypothetical protein
VPYTHATGPEGVEVLKFRHALTFDLANHANGLSFWQKTLEAVAAKQGEWATATMPGLAG